MTESTKLQATKEERKTAETASWDAFIAGVKGWATDHMDQWEKVKFETPFGTVYVTVSRRDLYPNSFDEV